MRLVEPMKSGFQTIAPRSGNKVTNKKGYGSGKETLRFKANGNAAIEDEVRIFPKKRNNCGQYQFYFLIQARRYYTVRN
jgi:hypothetical protein